MFLICRVPMSWSQEMDFPDTAAKGHGYRLRLIIQGANLDEPKDSFGSELAERYYTGTYTGKLRLVGQVSLIPHLLARGSHQLNVRIFANGRQVAEFQQRLSERKVTEFDLSTASVEGQLEFFVHANRLGEDGVRVRGILEHTVAEDHLAEILRLYADEVPVGRAPSGPANNLRSYFESGLNDFRCGGYQAQVLKFLDTLRFDPDPQRRRLLADFDYGPVEASLGYHQAVVIYPRGSDWRQTGIILDPWPNQRPEHFTMTEWVRRFLLPRPSRIRAVEGDDHYAIYGKAYRQPDPTLTESERKFIQALPAEEKAKQRSLDPWERKAWLAGARQIQTKNGHLIVDCPVEAYMLDKQGRYTGLRRQTLSDQIPATTVLHYMRSSNDNWYEMTFDPASVEALELVPLQQGQAQVSWRVRGRGENSHQVSLQPGRTVKIPLHSPENPPARQENTLFDNFNGEGTSQGSPQALRIRFARPFQLSLIQTYHWNSGQGAPPGSIGLVRVDDGKAFGPWPAQGSPGQGGVANAYWQCRPQVSLPAGTYEVTCSSPASWSYNQASQGLGFAVLKGHYTGPALTARDLMGNYRLTDLARSKSQYYADVRLLGEGKGWVREYMKGRLSTGRYPEMADPQGFFPVMWSYDSSTGEFVLDWSLSGQLPGLGRFAGSLSGQPSKFVLTGNWSSGKAATIQLQKSSR